MNHTCKCGGRIRSADETKPVVVNGRTCYQDVRVKPGFASFYCDRCNKRSEQKLRTPR